MSKSKQSRKYPDVAVITPYYKEDDTIIRKCIESVLSQKYNGNILHVLIADGFPKQSVVEAPGVRHVILPNANGDNGNTPRAIGSLVAMNTPGIGAIAYLDADNWYYDSHIRTLVDLHHRTGADFCSSNRYIHHLDGTLMGKGESGDGKHHVDTSSLMMFPRAFRMGMLWGMMPRQLSPHCDRVFFQAIRGSGFSHAHSDEYTMAFRTQYVTHYECFGFTPPSGAKTPDENDPPLHWWQSLSDEQRLNWQRFFAMGGWQ